MLMKTKISIKFRFGFIVQGAKEDPWISLNDHHSAISKGNILYGGNKVGKSYATNVLPKHNGANVFVRMQGETDSIL